MKFRVTDERGWSREFAATTAMELGAGLAALRWAIGEIVQARGALPEDLQKLRLSVWP